MRGVSIVGQGAICLGFSTIAMISAGSSLPSSVPVIARNSNSAATRLRPWPKFNCTVMYDVGRGVERFVECDRDVGGAVLRGVGRPAVFVAGVEDVLGPIIAQPRVGGDAVDAAAAGCRFTWSPGTVRRWRRRR